MIICNRNFQSDTCSRTYFWSMIEYWERFHVPNVITQSLSTQLHEPWECHEHCCKLRHLILSIWSESFKKRKSIIQNVQVFKFEQIIAVNSHFSKNWQKPISFSRSQETWTNWKRKKKSRVITIGNRNWIEFI